MVTLEAKGHPEQERSWGTRRVERFALYKHQQPFSSHCLHLFIPEPSGNTSEDKKMNIRPYTIISLKQAFKSELKTEREKPSLGGHPCAYHDREHWCALGRQGAQRLASEPQAHLPIPCSCASLAHCSIDGAGVLLEMRWCLWHLSTYLTHAASSRSTWGASLPTSSSAGTCRGTARRLLPRDARAALAAARPAQPRPRPQPSPQCLPRRAP